MKRKFSFLMLISMFTALFVLGGSSLLAEPSEVESGDEFGREAFEEDFPGAVYEDDLSSPLSRAAFDQPPPPPERLAPPLSTLPEQPAPPPPPVDLIGEDVLAAPPPGDRDYSPSRPEPPDFRTDAHQEGPPPQTRELLVPPGGDARLRDLEREVKRIEEQFQREFEAKVEDLRLEFERKLNEEAELLYTEFENQSLEAARQQ